MPRRLLLIAVLLVARSSFALDPTRPLTQFVHDVWETNRGLPQATVRAIVQTRDGYLWIGTEEGLARFDGVQFKTFSRRDVPAFRANHVLSLLEDRSGSLWIGTLGGGLMRYRNGAFTTLTRADGLPSDYVYSLHESSDGTIWIGARGSVALLRRGQLTRWNPPTLVEGTIWSIEQDRSGVTWVGSDLYGLTRIEGGVPKTYAGRDAIPHDAIPVVRQLADGRIVIGTNGAGLFEWSAGRFIPYRAKGTLPSEAITALAEDSSGNLWIGTDAGLARAADGVITAGAPGELGRSPIHAITEDREGNLWIGTSGAGLHCLRDGKVRTMTSADGLPSDTIHTVFHDSAGRAWIGTRNGVARVAGGTITTRITTWSTRNGLPNDSVRSLFQSSDGAMWIGTELGGVARIVGDRIVETMVLDRDVPDNTVRAFAEQAGGVWIGTNGGPLTLLASGIARPGKTRLFVRAMAAEKNGSLWVATDGNGLHHFVDGAFRKAYTERDGLSRDGLRSLYVDAEGTLWIGTDGGGLNRLKNGKVTVYGTQQGLFDDVILQILEGDDGRLWMSSNNGIFAVRKDSLNAYADGKITRVESLFLDEHDGMISRDCAGGSQPAGAKSADGRLWFPTNAGVVIVDPRHMRRNAQPPPVHVEHVVADRAALRGDGGAFAIPRGTKNLEITYAALSFVVPERVRFRYKLDGYDDQWIDAGARRTAYYTALPPGQYRFRVIAANDDGVWNDTGATVSLSLSPYFYQRRSFALLVLALIGAAIWAVEALRIRRVRMEAAQAAEMERRLVITQRMDALGQMASGIAHDFNNALMAASPWAETILRQYSEDPVLQRSGLHIINAIERAKRVTHQLLDFAQPKQPEVLPVDLGDVVRDEVSMARAVLPPEIHVETRIAPTRVLAIGDRVQLGQVVLNLLLNARDAMPNGGRLAIDVREPTHVEAASWHVDREAFALLSVSDTGVGMSREVREKIFDPFFTTKGVGKGSGLGLAVVHRVVQDHHGAVHVDTAPGKGTTFFVLLRKATNMIPAPQRASIDAPAIDRTDLQILLIDDEAVIREAILGVLGAEGMTVEVASTGSEALRLIAGGFRPDLVILDLGLPEMTGDRVHTLIRERFPEVPILIASGYGDSERLEPLLRDAKTAYVQKPFKMQVLIEQIAAMVR